MKHHETSEGEDSESWNPIRKKVRCVERMTEIMQRIERQWKALTEMSWIDQEESGSDNSPKNSVSHSPEEESKQVTSSETLMVSSTSLSQEGNSEDNEEEEEEEEEEHVISVGTDAELEVDEQPIPIGEFIAFSNMTSEEHKEMTQSSSSSSSEDADSEEHKVQSSSSSNTSASYGDNLRNFFSGPSAFSTP